MQRDRDFDRDDRRRRSQQIDDPRASTRERYGNEEDEYSREARRAYSEQDLPRRMHDDRAYNQPGYEPEVGLPGGRENVDLDRERGRPTGRGSADAGGQGRNDEQWRRGAGGDSYGYDFERPAGDRGQAGQRSQRQTFGSSGDDWYAGQGDPYSQRQGTRQDQRYRTSQSSGGYSSSRPASPYDQGELGSWYGGDTGMGDSGSSLDRTLYRNQGRSAQQGQQRSFQQTGQYSQAGQSSQPARHDQSWQSGQQQHDVFDGPFTGRGPRGYQRSDERIREDVCELLTRHGEIDASSMEVDVQRGTVILRGTADSGRIRRLTEEIVEEIPGVRDVENQLRVNQRTGYSDTTSDTPGAAPADSQRMPQMRGVPAYGVGVAETSGASTRTGPGEPGLSAGAGPSQHGNRWQIRETMDVVGADGESVGTVKLVRGTDFQVDRPMSRDLYIPFSAVRTVDSERVLLSCRASEVDQQNWPSPSVTGGVTGTGS